MNETAFDIDPHQLAEAARRFPAHRHTTPLAQPNADVSYLATQQGSDFCRHAWDESGRL